jgi:hypothetical protein
LLDHNEMSARSVIHRRLSCSSGVAIACENSLGQATTRSMSIPIGPVCHPTSA